MKVHSIQYTVDSFPTPIYPKADAYLARLRNLPLDSTEHLCYYRPDEKRSRREPAINIRFWHYVIS